MNPTDYRGCCNFSKKPNTNNFRIRDAKGQIWILETDASAEIIDASIKYLKALDRLRPTTLFDLLKFNDFSIFTIFESNIDCHFDLGGTE